MDTKKCNTCDILKLKSDFRQSRSKCNACDALITMIETCGVFVIPYEPIGDGTAKVNGANIRVVRKLAGIKSTYHMAALCKWSQSVQSNYERLPPDALISLWKIQKMIRVCNGEMIIPRKEAIQNAREC